jgi:uncharacterized membrane protein HdeD (DUF308 family)
MRDFLEATWWMILLRGLALLLFGFFAIVWPALTLYSLALGFAVYLVVAGVLNLTGILGGISRLPLWFLGLVLAAVEIGVGVYALKHLSMTAATLILLIGLVFVVRGILEVISAFGDGYEGRNRSMAAILGVLSLTAGLIVWLYPGSSALALAWVVGLYGIVAGSFLVAVALEARPVLNRLSA